MKRTIRIPGKPRFLNRAQFEEAKARGLNEDFSDLDREITIDSVLLVGCSPSAVDAVGTLILLECQDEGLPAPRQLSYTRQHDSDGRCWVTITASTWDADHPDEFGKRLRFEYRVPCEDKDGAELAQINIDHCEWPLGTLVYVRRGHHSPRPFSGIGRVDKHGYPCTDGVNCIVQFRRPVMDTTFGAARYCHYVDYKNLVRVKDALQIIALVLVGVASFSYSLFFA